LTKIFVWTQPQLYLFLQNIWLVCLDFFSNKTRIFGNEFSVTIKKKILGDLKREKKKTDY
jgi:hypothetical protein